MLESNVIGVSHGTGPHLDSSLEARQIDTEALHCQHEMSSLHSLKCSKERGVCSSLWTCVTLPFTILGTVFAWVGRFLSNYVCCCCKYPVNEDAINWEETHEQFRKCYNAVHDDSGLKDNCQIALTEGLKALSKPAMERLKTHLGHALAKTKGCATLADQERWCEKNKTAIDFQKHFENVKDHILKEAITAFDKEIIRNKQP